MLFGRSFFPATAMVAALGFGAAALPPMFIPRASASFPYRGRGAGDRAHKRWKRTRAAGRR